MKSETSKQERVEVKIEFIYHYQNIPGSKTPLNIPKAVERIIMVDGEPYYHSKVSSEMFHNEDSPLKDFENWLLSKKKPKCIVEKIGHTEDVNLREWCISACPSYLFKSLPSKEVLAMANKMFEYLKAHDNRELRKSLIKAMEDEDYNLDCIEEFAQYIETGIIVVPGK
jgi:hypothetical protein